MTKIYQSVLGTILGASILAFSGCGGDDSSDVSTAYLVDSNVSGVNYTCGTQSGTTGTDGSFRYQHGQTCTFSIGATTFSVAADKLAAGKSVTPYDIFAGDDEKVVNLARLFQTLDSDKNAANGIDINATAHALITTQIEFGSNFDTNLTSVLATSTYLPIVTPVAALAHLATNVPVPTSYTTFERIAEIDASAIATASGFTNPTDQARYVAQKIAKYFNDKNDLTLGDSIADWVLGGSSMTGTDDSNITHYNPYILEIPSPDNNKTMIVEVCNKTHAGKAINSSEIHGPALPCEIAIYTDTTTGKIYVDILDPVGSFAIFFNDLTTLTSEQRAEFSAMALQVKTEIKLIAYKGLALGSVSHVKKATPMGATFTSADIAAMSNQYITYTYDIDTTNVAWPIDANATVKRAMANDAAIALIKKMTVNIPYGYTSAFASAPYISAGTYGINGTDLNTTLVGNADYNLSETGYWRSARKAPLKVPRSPLLADDYLYTVEACSPTYAKLALSMGGDSRDHATALPCQMSFYIDDSNASAPKLKIVFLNPEFMFQILFKDKLAGLSAHEQASLGAMATTVKNDLVNITRHVMDYYAPGWIVSQAIPS